MTPQENKEVLEMIREWRWAGGAPRADLAPGLTREELQGAERRWDIRFPDDLACLLRAAVPLGEGFPNWRDPHSSWIQAALRQPADGICFDIEHNNFWWSEWGPKPDVLNDALALARRMISEAPRLVPIHGHRYIPTEPTGAGNPVFSVCQTDIIIYACDLFTYAGNEFRTGNKDLCQPDRTIRFWSALVASEDSK